MNQLLLLAEMFVSAILVTLVHVVLGMKLKKKRAEQLSPAEAVRKIIRMQYHSEVEVVLTQVA